MNASDDIRPSKWSTATCYITFKAGQNRDRVRNLGQFSVPKDLVIFPGLAVKIRDSPEKIGTDGHLTHRQCIIIHSICEPLCHASLTCHVVARTRLTEHTKNNLLTKHLLQQIMNDLCVWCTHNYRKQATCETVYRRPCWKWFQLLRHTLHVRVVCPCVCVCVCVTSVTLVHPGKATGLWTEWDAIWQEHPWSQVTTY